MIWAGVDVGGTRKGFHAVVIDERAIVSGPRSLATPTDTASWLASFEPMLTAVDGPIAPAPDGWGWRPCERELAQAVCGIRWTPSQDALERSPGYYGWVLNGLALYDLLAAEKLQAVECFPTASFTRWAGKRPSGTSRAVWTRDALRNLGLDRLPARTNQDERDAIAAAVTARLHAGGLTEMFGEIVVPLAGPDELRPSRPISGRTSALPGRALVDVGVSP